MKLTVKELEVKVSNRIIHQQKFLNNLETRVFLRYSLKVKEQKSAEADVFLRDHQSEIIHEIHVFEYYLKNAQELNLDGKTRQDIKETLSILGSAYSSPGKKREKYSYLFYAAISQDPEFFEAAVGLLDNDKALGEYLYAISTFFRYPYPVNRMKRLQLQKLIQQMLKLINKHSPLLERDTNQLKLECLEGLIINAAKDNHYSGLELLLKQCKRLLKKAEKSREEINIGSLVSNYQKTLTKALAIAVRNRKSKKIDKYLNEDIIDLLLENNTVLSTVILQEVLTPPVNNRLLNKLLNSKNEKNINFEGFFLFLLNQFFDFEKVKTVFKRLKADDFYANNMADIVIPWIEQKSLSSSASIKAFALIKQILLDPDLDQTHKIVLKNALKNELNWSDALLAVITNDTQTLASLLRYKKAGDINEALVNIRNVSFLKLAVLLGNQLVIQLLLDNNAQVMTEINGDIIANANDNATVELLLRAAFKQRVKPEDIKSATPASYQSVFRDVSKDKGIKKINALEVLRTQLVVYFRNREANRGDYFNNYSRFFGGKSRSEKLGNLNLLAEKLGFEPFDKMAYGVKKIDFSVLYNGYLGEKIRDWEKTYGFDLKQMVAEASQQKSANTPSL